MSGHEDATANELAAATTVRVARVLDRAPESALAHDPDALMARLSTLDSLADLLKKLRRRVELEHERLVAMFGAAFEEKCAELIRAQRLAGIKKQSVDLTGGRAGYRMNKGRVVIFDEATAIAWAREHSPESLERPRIARTTFIRDQLDIGNAEVATFARVEGGGHEFYPDIDHRPIEMIEADIAALEPAPAEEGRIEWA